MWNRFLRIFSQKQKYTKRPYSSDKSPLGRSWEYDNETPYGTEKLPKSAQGALRVASLPSRLSTIIEDDCGMFDDNAIQSHTIYFDNDPTKHINIQYCTVFGELEHEYNMYDRTGQLMSSASYKKGKLHGDRIEYNVYVQQSDGSLKRFHKYIRSYENGREVLQKTVDRAAGGGRIFDA